MNFFFKQYWIDKYAALGLEFPSSDINGVVWLLWGFIFAGCIVFLRRKLEFMETFLVSWVSVFVLMWIVIGNMNMLPFGLLKIAVPWSLVEVGLAILIAQGIMAKPKAEQGHAANVT